MRIDESIRTLAAVSGSFSQKNHAYLTLENGLCRSVSKKSESCSFKGLVNFAKTLTAQNLTDDQKKSLQSSLKTITAHFQAKKVAWYFRIPIVSCIYNRIKAKLLSQSNEMQKKLNVVAPTHTTIKEEGIPSTEVEKKLDVVPSTTSSTPNVKVVTPKKPQPIAQYKNAQRIMFKGFYQSIPKIDQKIWTKWSAFFDKYLKNSFITINVQTLSQHKELQKEKDLPNLLKTYPFAFFSYLVLNEQIQAFTPSDKFYNPDLEEFTTVYIYRNLEAFEDPYATTVEKLLNADRKLQESKWLSVEQIQEVLHLDPKIINSTIATLRKDYYRHFIYVPQPKQANLFSLKAIEIVKVLWVNSVIHSYIIDDNRVVTIDKEPSSYCIVRFYESEFPATTSFTDFPTGSHSLSEEEKKKYLIKQK